MSEKINVLAFAGSLRKGSYNKALIRTALDVAPENVVLEVFDLEGFHCSIRNLKQIRRRGSRNLRTKSETPTPS